MAAQITTNTEALRLFFTEDVYLVPDELLVSENDSTAAAIVEVPAVKYTPQLAAQVEKSVKKEFTFLGKNGRNILILVNDALHPVSTENGRELLWKIVKAINLTAKDFAVVNYTACTDTTFQELQACFQPQLLLAFGVLPEVLGLKEQPQHILGKQDMVTAIFSSDLHALAADLPAKKLLWKSLQQLTLV